MNASSSALPPRFGRADLLQRAKDVPSRVSPIVGDRPPRPRLTLNVGITGHRATILSQEVIAALIPHVDAVFASLGAATGRLHARAPELFDRAEPWLRLHTPLASGADQVAATSARNGGFHVRALLPFAPDEYRKDFAAGLEAQEFDGHLERAEQIFALPGARDDDEAPYVAVGKAVIAASDILIAIWDGEAGNGRGGTAHVVELALANAVPVIHIRLDRESGSVDGVRLLIGGDAMDPQAEAIGDDSSYDSLVQATLAPQTKLERDQFAEYVAERERLFNPRIEYPLLLSLLRIKALPSRPWRQGAIATEIKRDWEAVHEPYPLRAGPRLATAYGWANFLAIRYAQLFRSGHVTNYVLSALAVLIALLGVLIPGVKVFLVILELGVIALLFHNTRAGTSGDWHRKWLQYRHLAESLRPLIYLKQTGLISTPFRNDPIHSPVHRVASADWTRWYAAAVWRELESPQGIIEDDDVRRMVRSVIDEQILPQAQYHRVNAERMHKLDHRLHEIGNFLMGAVIAACVLFLAGYVLVPDWIKMLTDPFIFLTAGLPAAGAAVFGMRGHGEHLLAASRSANTADALLANAARLEPVTTLEGLATELENTARIMLADLNEWTISYSERSLEIPA